MPGRRLRARPHRRRGHLAHEPAEGRPRASARPRRALGAARAHPARARGPTPCSAAAATSPGRSGSPRSLRRIPLVLTEADSHLGLTNRLLAAARAPRLPRVPDRRAATATRYLRHRPPRAADGRPTARSARAAARHRAGRDLRARLRRLARRALDQPRGASRRSPTRPTASCTSPAGATSPTCARPARTTSCATTSTPFGLALAAADLAVARAGGSVFELAQYGLPAVLIPYPHASADHQTANARWMARRAAPRSILARRRADARAAARARSTRSLARPRRGCAAMAAAAARARAPGRRARRSPREVLAAAA